MRYFNESDSNKYRKNIILEEYDISKATFAKDKTNVFLSYSSKDSDHLESVINFIESFGVRVYIDKKDPSLPPRPSAKTASILKDNIIKCDKFVVLVSEKSHKSIWMPWELGIADMKKTTKNIALLPISQISEIPWEKQTYLELYDRIRNGSFKNQNANVWMVYTPSNNTGMELDKWLKNK